MRTPAGEAFLAPHTMGPHFRGPGRSLVTAGEQLCPGGPLLLQELAPALPQNEVGEEAPASRLRHMQPVNRFTWAWGRLC